MDIHVRRQSYMFTSPFSFYSNRGLKSTQEKQERQMQCDREVGFWEEKKENLKTMQCNTLEEIARKLELFHNYEEEISAVKSAYNNEQMWHVMDEAKEIGEKIAEEAEKQKPKTPEEREEERRKEALGTEEDQGEMSELLEDMGELTEEVQEELETELKEQEEAVSQEQNIQEIEETVIAQEQDLQEAQEDIVLQEQSWKTEQERADVLTEGKDFIEEQKMISDRQQLWMKQKEIQDEKRMMLEEYIMQGYKPFDMRI